MYSFLLVMEKRGGLFCRGNNPIFTEHHFKIPSVNVYMMLLLLEQHVIPTFMVAAFSAIILPHTS